jgi:hypothetical protein
MSKRNIRIAAALLLALLPAAPALAGWKLTGHGTAVAVAKGTLKVTPGEEWNRGSARPIPKGELWTLDGVTLNQLYFVSGLVPGETLYRDGLKKDRPLPRMVGAMQLTDIPEFFESSNRLVLNTSVFQVTATEPTRFGGHDGVRFRYEYAIQNSTLTVKGEAVATIADNKLYLISFAAPSLFYFDRDRAKAEAIMASATF